MADDPALQTDFDALWDFNDPVAAELKFRELLPEPGEAGDRGDRHLQLLTQIARAVGLQRRFEESHALLDDVETQLERAAPVVKVRYLLERGRVFNSAKQPDLSKPLFREAWELGRQIGEDGFAVDAAHMLGIVEPGDEGHAWNLRALELANSSSDPRARKWAGSLHNNIGWTFFGRNDFPAALQQFEQALECRQRDNDAANLGVAKWCIARTLRALERVDEALAMQRELAADGEPDGYVCEELGECLLALNRAAEAAPHFARAWELLSQDPWLAENEPDRLQRLKERGGVN